MSKKFWENQAITKGASHLIVMYDPDDKELYPVFVMPNEDLKRLCSCLELSEGHQKIQEIVPINHNNFNNLEIQKSEEK